MLRSAAPLRVGPGPSISRSVDGDPSADLRVTLLRSTETTAERNLLPHPQQPGVEPLAGFSPSTNPANASTSTISVAISRAKRRWTTTWNHPVVFLGFSP